MDDAHMLANQLSYEVCFFVTQAKPGAKGADQFRPSDFVPVEMGNTIFVYSAAARFADIVEQNPKFQHDLSSSFACDPLFKNRYGLISILSQ
jgi:hypothetical protein